jgi:hypothetical protein
MNTMWWLGWMMLMFSIIYSAPALLIVAVVFFIISMNDD